MNTSRWKIQILLSACLFFAACGQKNMENTGDLPVVDVIGNFGNYEVIPVSQYVTELEYIPLETSYNCLIGEEYVGLIVTSTHIFVRGSRYCYAFGRDGRFLGQIGSYGQGPGEYTNVYDFTIDEKNQSLYLETHRTLLEYSWDGGFRQSIDLPKDSHGNALNNISFVHDSLFIGHFRNHRGDLLHNFVLFDQSSQVIKLFDNYVQFNGPHDRVSWVNRSMKPLRVGERIYVKELGNDTLFYLNGQNELIPHFVFDIGEYTVTIEMREYNPPINDFLKGTFSEESIMIPSAELTGTQNHLFFRLAASGLSGKYAFPKEKDRPIINSSGSGLINVQSIRKGADVVLGIYDLANQTTQLLDTDPVSRRKGLINDLDGGLSFWPRYYTSDNELIDIWHVSEIKEVLTEDYFVAHEIKDPEAHQKLKDLVKKLDFEDNPVIVIGKLKPELIGENR